MLKPLVMYVLSYIGAYLFMLKPLVMLCFKLHWYIFIYVETIGYVMF